MSDSSSFFERLNNTSTPPMVMGILNVTPDSFYDGGKYVQKETILSQAQKMVNEGTDIIDVGGMSSRPGAKEISIEEEQDRVCAVITQIRKEFPLLEISIDTYRTKVAEEALNSGATIINDISGGDLCEDMFTLVAQKYVPYIMMHMKGTPSTMASETNYTHLVKDIITSLSQKVEKIHSLGHQQVIIDPGFGFAKTVDQNYELLANLVELKKLACPLLVGVSRKSMIYKLLDILPQESLNATTVLNTFALQQGARILRVHDVREAKQAVTLFTKLNEYS